MWLTMKEKKAVTKEIAKRYKKARKREKGKILDGLLSLLTTAGVMPRVY